MEHRPELDHVKFAQTAFLMEKAAKYIELHKNMDESLPFICGGDWNSMPVSSVLSAFYGEDVEEQQDMQPSQWIIPEDASAENRQVYQKVHKRLKRKREGSIFT